jgi:hypothetical protein
MVDRPPWPVAELTGARPSSRFGPRWLPASWGKEGGHHGESNLANTEAWKAARRWHTDSGTSTRKGGGVGTVRATRRSVGSVGSSPRVGRPFIWRRRGGGGQVPSMAGVEGPSMLPG